MAPSSSNTIFSWQHHQMCIAQATADMRDWRLLDSQSSVDLFCNPKLVTNICKVTDALLLAMNAGVLMTNTKADVPRYGMVWFDKNAMMNVFSLANVVNDYHVEFDSSKDNAFIVHSTTGLMKFNKTMKNLYVYKPKYTIGTIFLETFEDNKTFFTNRQAMQAKEVKQLLHTLGYPSVQDI